MHIESPNATSLIAIPKAYNAFADVFSTAKAAQLPLQHTWDCKIDLLPGVNMPHSKVNSLSLEKYVAEALGQGLISRSILLSSAGFFFLGEKRWEP